MDYYEFQMYQQLTGGGLLGNAGGWYAIVLLVIFCFISLKKSDQVHSVKQFRYAVIVFILALMAPSIIDFFFQLVEFTPNTKVRNSNKEMRWLLLIKSNIRPILLAISSAMLLFSIAPKSRQIVVAQSSEPRKHPLDD